MLQKKVSKAVGLIFFIQSMEGTSSERAVSTINSHASMAAARNMNAWSLVTRGPSFGNDLSTSSDWAGGVLPRRLVRLSSDSTSGKSVDREGDADRSMTPRCTSNDGSTLSPNTGRCEVEGIGNGGGEMEPKRMVMAWIKNRAFLKQ